MAVGEGEGGEGLVFHGLEVVGEDAADAVVGDDEGVLVAFFQHFYEGIDPCGDVEVGLAALVTFEEFAFLGLVFGVSAEFAFVLTEVHLVDTWGDFQAAVFMFFGHHFGGDHGALELGGINDIQMDGGHFLGELPGLADAVVVQGDVGHTLDPVFHVPDGFAVACEVDVHGELVIGD